MGMGMKIEQRIWTRAEGWSRSEGDSRTSAQLVLVFGSTSALKATPALDETRAHYPGAHVFGCSTSGEILGTQVLDDSVVSTAIEFSSTEIQCASVSVNGHGGSFQVGVALARSIAQEGLRHVLVLSDGLRVNGSRLVDGLESALPTDVTVTGGLSGDGERFEETLVVSDGPPESGTVGAVGFYGEDLRVGFGSLGGWDPFGPERRITRSTANVLYELDGRSALDLYKEYLGEHADGLPAAGLLFPLTILQAVASDEFREFLNHVVLGLRQYTGQGIVAEGIETEEELAVAAQIGIHIVQGYLFGEPGPIDLSKLGSIKLPLAAS